MFHLLKIATRVLLNRYNIIDKDSHRTLLLNLVVLVKPFITGTDTKIDDAVLKHIEFVLNNETLFDYVYRLVADQLQTEEILCEAAEEETIAKLLENTMPNNLPLPEAINPAQIVLLITQIISIINTIKNR